MKDEALKLALSKIASKFACCPNAAQELISEVKELLEQALAAPAQEPVAWMHEWDDGERIPMLRKREVDRSDIDSPKSVRPLIYGDTTPPAAQRQPLTDEQIHALDPAPDCMFDQQRIDFARAIEAAHGIKAVRPLVYGDTTPSAAPCTWTQSNDPNTPDTFSATCGAVWTFTEGGPAENNMHFCPECGGKVMKGGSA